MADKLIKMTEAIVPPKMVAIARCLPNFSPCDRHNMAEGPGKAINRLITPIKISHVLKSILILYFAVKFGADFSGNCISKEYKVSS